MEKETDLFYQSATTIIQKVKSKELSPVEVLDTFIKRNVEVNPKVNAFCTYAFDQAVEEAKKLEQSIMRNEDVGPLYGIPIGIKDLTATKGIRTTYGSRAFADHIPHEDVLAVKRIKKAGGIVLGKTNTPEFGFKGTTDNLLFGATKNPWHLQMTSGGSSGGSAAAVAAGLIPFAHGDDGGGSIRIPSSACGIFGLKPTYGRVPYVKHLDNMFGSQHPFLHTGPMARTVEDATLLFSIMTGPDSSDPYCLPNTDENFLEDIKQGIKGLKVAYSPNLDSYEVDIQVQDAMEDVVDRLRDLGCTVEEVKMGLKEHKDDFLNTFSTLWTANQAANHGYLLEEKRHLLCDEIVEAIEKGRTVTAVEYKQTEFVRTTVYHKIQHILNQYDLIITPTLATTAFPYEWMGPSEINGKKVDPYHEWKMTRIFNLTGHPVASMPIGFSNELLPIGMQVIGNRLADALVLRLCHQYQEHFPWEHRTPIL